MEINKENAINFKNTDWVEERHTDSTGFRNVNKYSPLFDEWIYWSEYHKLKETNISYFRDHTLLHEFRRDYLEFGAVSDALIKRFLTDRYFGNDKKYTIFAIEYHPKSDNFKVKFEDCGEDEVTIFIYIKYDIVKTLDSDKLYSENDIKEIEKIKNK